MQANEITNTAIVLIYSVLLEYIIFKELHIIGSICPLRGHYKGGVMPPFFMHKISLIPHKQGILKGYKMPGDWSHDVPIMFLDFFKKFLADFSGPFFRRIYYSKFRSKEYFVVS